MNRPMRRKDRAIGPEECVQILQACQYGVMSSVDPEGQPYGVPLSFTFKDKTVYFHCARDGHKIDNIRANDRVCFTCVGMTRPVYEKNNFSTFFESVVVFGQVREVVDEAEKRQALHDLCLKYLPDYMSEFDAAMHRSGGRTAVYAIDAVQITGKGKSPQGAKIV